MTAIPLLSGIVANNQAEFSQSYPLNLEPLALDNKIAKGQLRATSGTLPLDNGPGMDRGGVNWNDQCYRVMGTKLVHVSSTGVVTELGDVGGTGPVTFDFGFDRLGIRSGTSLFYYDGTTLSQVTDEDLGPVKDFIWIDGYYMTTDGTYVIVTELSDPFQILPLKYGSAEEDPDMVTGLVKLRNEPYVMGRYTIQVFRNVGGNGFPFSNLRGASIPYGCVSPSAKCLFAETFAFVGSAKGEALGVYLAGQGTATKVSTRAVDDALAAVADPTSIVCENRTYRNERRLFVHLPTESWVFLFDCSQAVQTEVWYRVQSGVGQPYRIRNATACYGQMIVGDLNSAAIGTLSDSIMTHFGETPEWQFDCGLVYNKGRGFIMKSVELIGLPGRMPHGTQATIFMSMTRDGQTWGVERRLDAGSAGERSKRLQWRPQTSFRNYAGIRFRGYDVSMPGFAACEAEIMPLAV